MCGDKSPVLKKGTEMAKKKKVTRRAWTAMDVRALKSLAKNGPGLLRFQKH
jgi:hypothetical protein